MTCKKFFQPVSLKVDFFQRKCVSERFWNIAIGKSIW